MSPSCAMACRSLGAPVRLCSPTPQQEKKEPITITQGEGQARVPITGLPFTESPNLFIHDRIAFSNLSRGQQGASQFFKFLKEYFYQLV